MPNCDTDHLVLPSEERGQDPKPIKPAASPQPVLSIQLPDTSSSYSEYVENLTPDIYQQLKKAVELGKWPSGEALSSQQQALCLQTVILYESQHVIVDERVGFMPKKACDTKDKPKQEEDQTIRWTQHQQEDDQ